jgi:hypothetical protein
VSLVESVKLTSASKSVRGIIRATEGAGTGSAARACKALGEVEELGVKLCPLG